MQVQERIVSVKRHTIGYVVDGAELTRREAVLAAKQGRLVNAKVINSDTYGHHLVGVGKVSLYDLPVRFPRSRRFANKRSA